MAFSQPHWAAVSQSCACRFHSHDPKHNDAQVGNQAGRRHGRTQQAGHRRKTNHGAGAKEWKYRWIAEGAESCPGRRSGPLG